MDKRMRYRGSLLAGAMGDALGYPVEFKTWRDIVHTYGEMGTTEIGPVVTDDTQMTLFTAEGMLLGRKNGMPMPACVYQSYLDWYWTQRPRSKGGAFRRQSMLLQEEKLHYRRAPGNTCLSALHSGEMGTVDEPINHSKGCGGVMRAAPCGMLRMLAIPDAQDAYAIQGAQAAAITHGDVMGYVPAAMLADIVHMICLEDGRGLAQIIRDGLLRVNRLFGEHAAFNAMMEKAMDLAQEDVPVRSAISSLGEGWVGDEALAIAVYCVLKFPDDIEKCLLSAVNHSGDSDSTGAIAGNILGAWLGEDALPQKWLDKLEMRELITHMADALWEADR